MTRTPRGLLTWYGSNTPHMWTPTLMPCSLLVLNDLWIILHRVVLDGLLVFLQMWRARCQKLLRAFFCPLTLSSLVLK